MKDIFPASSACQSWTTLRCGLCLPRVPKKMESPCQPVYQYGPNSSLLFLISVPHSRLLLPGIQVHICKLCSSLCLRAGAGDTQYQVGVIIDCDNCEKGEDLRTAVSHSDKVKAEVTAKEEQADHQDSTVKHGNQSAGSGSQLDNAQLSFSEPYWCRVRIWTF